MPVATLVSVEEYLATAFRPDCDFVDGQVLERNVGQRNHSQTQGYSYAWFLSRRDEWKLEPFVEQRVDVTGGRFRVPDVLLVRQPVPKEQVLTQPPYLCLEVMSPDDTMSGIQDRLDDYMTLGVPNIWVIDPWKRRAWTVTNTGWHTVLDGHLRTSDGDIGLPLADVLPAVE